MSSSLQQAVDQIVASNDYSWAWASYKRNVLALRETFNCRSLMEVGAGRSPLINEQEFRALNISYAINDISPSELAQAPNWPVKVCFDISAAAHGSFPTRARASYDLIFSKMVFEHIRDVGSAYKVIYDLLVDGGICVTFYPTLYCAPFLVNYVMPNSLSQILAKIFDPRADPKFPAYYNWCRSTRGVKRKLQRLGYREVVIVPFYGHNYYRSVPIVRTLEKQWRSLAQKHDLRPLSSFAYAILRK